MSHTFVSDAAVHLCIWFIEVNSYTTVIVPLFYSSKIKIKTFIMTRKYCTHLIDLMLSVV